MNSNKYFTGIIIRVIFIVFSALLLAFLSFKTNYLYSITSLIIIVCIQTWNLINYILKSRDDFKRMLEYIKENNPTMYFSNRVFPYNEIGFFLNEIGDIVREVRTEKENQFQYMQYVVQHIGIGLIAFNENGKVEIINQAAKNILSIPDINSIELLEKRHPLLAGIIKKMNPSDQKKFQLKSGNKLQYLAIRMSYFKIGQKEIKLISLQDIKNELDEKEMDSWQKLIRVLTHEIINSITPVTSLTTTISGFFKKGNNVIVAKDISDYKIQETLTGLELIEERGMALIEFVNNFRSLTKLPTPRFEEINVLELFQDIAILKRDEFTQKGISFNLSPIHEDIFILCDKNLIEHVILNLINNAIDAVINNPETKGKSIDVKSWLNDDRHPIISIMDNGKGIPDNLLDEIFMPFFTTKEQGSGIGLSLARQIMRLHNGSISVQSIPETKTTFLLKF